MLVVAAVSLMLCLRLFSLFVSRYRSKLSGFFFFLFVFFFFFPCFFFFFFLPLSLYPHSPFFSLSLPLLVDFPHNLSFFYFLFFYLFIYLFIFIFFPFFFLLSLSCFLCPLVLSVTVWLSKRVYKIKLIN